MTASPDFDISCFPSQEELAARFNSAATTNETLQQINEVYRTKVMFSAPERIVTLSMSSIYPEEGRALWYLTDKLKPSTVIEVGFGFGTSAAFFLAGVAPYDGRLISIDSLLSTWTEGEGQTYIEKLKLSPYHTLIEERSDIVLPTFITLKKLSAPLKLSFIDGSHFFEDKLLDFVFLDRMTEIGGVIAFDDAHAPSVRTLASFIAYNYPYRLHYVTSRLLLCQKMDTLEKREWCHFRPFQSSTKADWDIHTDRPDTAAVPGATFSKVR
jgi:predicted O-methyltransferase YrrM